MKKVLILGAGLVVKPIVEYLLTNGISLTIASPMKQRADEMIAGNPHGKSVDWSMDDPVMLGHMISETDIVVSLLPFKYHSDVAKVCLQHRKSLVTTSYVQKELEVLHQDAVREGIIFLNEIGLDPGIDHMSAMRIIDHIHNRGGKVEEFYSICGALPAPEAADNPMGYKFSWSPVGVILASRNGATYLKKGKTVTIDPVNLFKDRFVYNFPGIGEVEVYPNRDSLSYTDIYGIREASTMYRGTIRLKGWCETLDAMKNLGMLDETLAGYSPISYSGFLAERLGTDVINLRKKTASRLKISEDSIVIRSFDFLGFFSEENISRKESSPFEITSGTMIRKMMLKPEERDMVLLQHIVLGRYTDGSSEVIKSSMTDFGIPFSNTAIARTVALPAAIAVKMILEGKIKTIGVCRPVVPEIYNPVLEELKTLGIEMKEEFGLPESEMI